jgi:hydrogenase nickel incorporation protein HypA/HybF
MHELSIAEALIELVEKHIPPGGTVKRVLVEAGPARGIVDTAMQWAWEAARQDTNCREAKLELKLLPWKLKCTACGAEFEAQDIFATCACGHTEPIPAGGDDLRLMSIDVDVPEEAQNAQIRKT